MPEHRIPIEEIARRGDEIYEAIRVEMESKHDGKVVAIDVESGFYALNADVLSATDAVFAQNPEAEIWLVRIGKRNMTKFGWRGLQMRKRRPTSDLE